MPLPPRGSGRRTASGHQALSPRALAGASGRAPPRWRAECRRLLPSTERRCLHADPDASAPVSRPPRCCLSPLNVYWATREGLEAFFNAPDCDEPLALDEYLITRSWLNPMGNLLVTFEKWGGDPTGISMVDGEPWIQPHRCLESPAEQGFWWMSVVEEDVDGERFWWMYQWILLVDIEGGGRRRRCVSGGGRRWHWSRTSMANDFGGDPYIVGCNLICLSVGGRLGVLWFAVGDFAVGLRELARCFGRQESWGLGLGCRWKELESWRFTVRFRVGISRVKKKNGDYFYVSLPATASVRLAVTKAKGPLD